MQTDQCVSALGGLSIDLPVEIDPATQQSIVSRYPSVPDMCFSSPDIPFLQLLRADNRQLEQATMPCSIGQG